MRHRQEPGRKAPAAMDPLQCWQQATNPTNGDRLKLMALAALVILVMLIATFLTQGSGSRTPGSQRSDFMDCEGAAVCGVLTLQSGLGSGVYRKWPPMVHGLWPQVTPYGNSACLPPTGSSADPIFQAPCFDSMGLEVHEWRKHGTCSGVKDATDFGRQVCQLAAAPLKLMEGAGQDFQAQQQALQAAGVHIYNVDVRNQQFELSACAGCNGTWMLVPPARFTELCAGHCPPPQLMCRVGQRGPPCTSDRDCAGAHNCLRCARSGFCTDVPR
jgi:hypothetical protein